MPPIDPTLSLALALGSLLLPVLHGLGYRVPVLSWLIDAGRRLMNPPAPPAADPMAAVHAKLDAMSASLAKRVPIPEDQPTPDPVMELLGRILDRLPAPPAK